MCTLIFYPLSKNLLLAFCVMDTSLYSDPLGVLSDPCIAPYFWAASLILEHYVIVIVTLLVSLIDVYIIHMVFSCWTVV